MFHERLQWLVTLKNIEREDIEKGTGYDETRISKYLSGKAKAPQQKTIKKFSDFFGCDPLWLKTGDGDPFPHKTEESKPEYKKKFKLPETDQEKQAELDSLKLYHFKMQCTAYLDGLIEFIADTYGADQEGVNDFLDELYGSHANYRDWLRSKQKNQTGTDD